MIVIQRFDICRTEDFAGYLAYWVSDALIIAYFSFSLLGVAGGFQTDEKKFEFEETTSIVVLPQWEQIPLPNNDLPMLVIFLDK